MNEKLLPCPFCGGQPVFSSPYEHDDRRAMRMDLECCVTMRESIPYYRFKEMTEKEIEKKLVKELIKEWNTRVQPDEEKPI